MKALAAVTTLAVAGGLLAAASGDDWVPAAPATPAAERAAKTTELKLKRTEYGRVLFSGGFALYLFTRDEGRKSKCYGNCADAWPPLGARGELVAGRGVKPRLLGTTTRRNGREQVTYDGHPLYFYVNDPRGEVFCNDVEQFGGVWFAVRRSGEPAD